MLTPDSDIPSTSSLELAPGVFIPLDALRIQFSRSSGPGGQNVNKVNTKAELWAPVLAIRGLAMDAIQRLMMQAGSRLTKEGEIHIVGDSRRSAERNRAEVLDRLRALIVEAMHRPKPRRKTRPSAGSKKRRLESKKKRSEVKAGRRFKDGD